MAAIAPSAGRSTGAYRALETRNRLIAVLRILVPLIGLMVLATLLIQMLVANLDSEFRIGSIVFERNKLSVDAPSYSGMLADGTSYDMSAGSAETALDDPGVVQLNKAHVVMRRSDGVDVTADAALASVQVQQQIIDVPGTATLSDTAGIKATITAGHGELAAQIVTGGKTHLETDHGVTLDAEAMSYDAKARVWRFTGVTMRLPDIPDVPEAK